MLLGSALLCSAANAALLLRSVWLTFKLLKQGAPIPIDEANNSAERSAESTELLRTWTLMSFLSLYEYALEWLFFWVPLYYEVKLGLLCWMLLPSSSASTTLFDRALRPLMSQADVYLFQRVFPFLSTMSLRAYSRILPFALPALIYCFPPEELRRWDQLVDEQLEAVQTEMARRNLDAGGDDDGAIDADGGAAAAGNDDATVPSRRNKPSVDYHVEEVSDDEVEIVTPVATPDRRARRKAQMKHEKSLSWEAEG